MAWIAVLLLALSSSAFTLDLHGKVSWNDQCSNITQLGPSKVILDDGRHYGGITQDGSFVIPDVPVGTFILSVLAHDHSFDQLRLDVVDASAAPQVCPYIPGTPLNPPSTIVLPYPISLVARQKLDYSVPKESFPLLGMLRNPTVIMMIFVAGMALAMPTLMKYMDPEVLEEFQQRQAKVTKLRSSLQSGDVKASLSAILSPDESPASTTSSGVKSQQSSQQRNRKTKKR